VLGFQWQIQPLQPIARWRRVSIGHPRSNRETRSLYSVVPGIYSLDVQNFPSCWDGKVNTEFDFTGGHAVNLSFCAVIER
jgi:hypothetical protein